MPQLDKFRKSASKACYIYSVLPSEEIQGSYLPF